MKRLIIFIMLFGVLNTAMAEISNQKSIADIPKEKWGTLLNKKIFFGHQSVGKNIIDGIEDLKKDYPWLEFNIVDTKESGDINGPVFAHQKVGKNREPDTKMEEFKNILHTDLLGGSADIAALKFCYVDIQKDTNVLKVFNKYKETVEELKANNPDTLIIHFTVPLKTVQSGWKGWVKEITGRTLQGAEENILRNQYNKMLVSEFSNEDLVFDIARLESTLPDGSRREFKDNYETYYSLAEEYTYDGGHLNEMGRKYIAEQFLLFLLENAS